MLKKTQDLHILGVETLKSPQDFKAEMAMSEVTNRTVCESRQAVIDIINQRDKRLLVIIGPCSIHDERACMDYAARLNRLRIKYQDKLLIVMRVYFEKPRTTIGWRGLIIDPHLDGSYDVAHGLKIARRILLNITDMGMGTATEMLDTTIPQYIADLITWSAIGARTTESQTHRNMTSGLSMPVGFKNSTEGNLQVALDAMTAAAHKQSFLGINQAGQTSILKTSGNPHTHIILRGSQKKTNYQPNHIRQAIGLLRNRGLNTSVMVDCSHGNSKKNHNRQEGVLKSVIRSRSRGLKEIGGIMLESNLVEGSQKIPADQSQLLYGCSITDKCIGWEKTAELMEHAYRNLI